MNGRYPLYHTLNHNIPKTKLTKNQETDLAKKLCLVNEDAKKAVVMLITEHSRVEGQYVYDPKNVVIPYSGTQEGNDVIFDLGKFPNELKWVLWKFVNLLNES